MLLSRLMEPHRVALCVDVRCGLLLRLMTYIAVGDMG